MEDFKLPVILPVVGVSFHQDIVMRAQTGDRVAVIAEPHNPYDVNACAVMMDGEVLGHLSRVNAERIRRSGFSAWEAVIVDVIAGEHPTALRIKVLAPLDAEGGNLLNEHLEPEVRIEARTAVRARSGRVLGKLAAYNEMEVTVLTPNGKIVTYPIDLVVIAAGR